MMRRDGAGKALLSLSIYTYFSLFPLPFHTLEYKETWMGRGDDFSNSVKEGLKKKKRT